MGTSSRIQAFHHCTTLSGERFAFASSKLSLYQVGYTDIDIDFGLWYPQWQHQSRPKDASTHGLKELWLFGKFFRTKSTITNTRSEATIYKARR
jgi:hypothetical protein